MKRLDSIFIQPTYTCALNCKGCYVKESVQNPEMPVKLWKEFLDYRWDTNRYQVGHVTLALDDLAKKSVSSNAYEKMSEIAGLVHLKRINNPDKIDLHITAHNIRTLEQYGAGNIIPWIRFIENIDLITLSNMGTKDAEFMYKITSGDNSCILNYNYMPYGINTSNLHKNLNSFMDILTQYVDMAYIILHKAGLGHRNDPKSISMYKESLRYLDKQ